MRWKPWVAAVLVLVALAGTAYTVHVFVLLIGAWPTGSTITWQLQLGPGSGRLSDGKTSWNKVGTDATNQWNRTTLKASPLRFAIVNNAPGTKLSGDGRNSIFFAKTFFGMAFGSSTLAVPSRGARSRATCWWSRTSSSTPRRNSTLTAAPCGEVRLI